MIIVKLVGGLGNQMFQYALGRQLSTKTSSVLKLDISWFVTQKLRAYELKHFNIRAAGIASPAETLSLRRFGAKKGLFWTLRNCLFADTAIYIKEKRSLEFQFDPTIMSISDTAYLDGYWQNEKYFKDIEEIIRKEFVAQDIMGDKDKVAAQSITRTNSVSVHIRRGDYITNAKVNAIHGACDINYYLRAAEIIAAKTPNPYFFVFSDDHEWVKKNIIFNHPTTYVAHNDTDKNYQDLRLMSMCRHNIIANSSFSWWGAWLNENPEKIIVAPKKWLNDSTRDTSDLIPKTWIRI